MSFDIVIPARLNSSRLAHKVLQDIAGKSMLQRVYEQAQKSAAENIIIATDSHDILDSAKDFGAKTVLTQESHNSGTERIAEVIEKLGIAPERIIVGLQADEPFMAPALINQVATLVTEQTPFATLYQPIVEQSDLFNPNIVKVVFDSQERALYFSRAPIPWCRDGVLIAQDTQVKPGLFYRHIGLYAYQAQLIKRYVAWPESYLEQLEKLEQLRVLTQGIPIQLAQACADAQVCVDTKEDLQIAREYAKILATC